MYAFIKKNLLLIGAVACLYPLQVSAQNKLSVHAKADFVSDYIWRGADQQSGCSVQPSLTLGYAGFLSIFGVASHSPNGKKEVPKNGISTSDIPTGILQSPYPTTGGAVSTSLMAITKTAIISRALWLTALAILFRYPFHGVPCLPGQTRMRRVICRHPLIFRPPMYSGCLLT